MSSLKKFLLSLVILGSVTSAIGAGTFASFTATTSNPGNTFATGTLTIDTDHSGASFVGLTGMIPGDSVAALLTIQSTGTEDMTYTLTTDVTATTAGAVPPASNLNVLTTDTTNGLQLYVQRCSQAWTGSGASSTCGGTAADVVGTSASPVALIGSGGANTYTSAARSMGTLCDSDVTGATRSARSTTCSNTASSSSDYLKIRVSLPSSADNGFQGRSATARFTWDGTSVSGVSF